MGIKRIFIYLGLVIGISLAFLSFFLNENYSKIDSTFYFILLLLGLTMFSREFKKREMIENFKEALKESKNIGDEE